MAAGLLSATFLFVLLVLLASSVWPVLSTHRLLSSHGSLFLALKLDNQASPRDSPLPKSSCCGTTLPPCLKMKAGLYVSKIGMSALFLVLLSGDVCINPGPVLTGPATSAVINSSFPSTTASSDDDSLSEDSTEEVTLDGSLRYSTDNSSFHSTDLQTHFNLGLGNKGLRFGSWNVNGLTMSKFDQIRLFMLDSNNRPQVDILSINESALKPKLPDSLYAVPGFTTHRRDRKGSKKKGGVLVYVNQDVKHRRRTDLEDSNIEAVWLEVFPYKSKRPLLFAGVYRPPSYSKEDDELLEKNIESAYLLNLETIISGDTNVNYLATLNFKKHRLVRALTSMNFKQLVTKVTRPISKTCLDHIFANCPERIHSIVVKESGLADHLPVFAVRSYKGKERPHARGKPCKITYRNMKDFDELRFVSTLKDIPWDTAFVFDTIDDMLGTWEQLFNNALDQHCPWREKRVKTEKQAPWMTREVLQHLHRRDSLLKKAKISALPADWEIYKIARNKATNAIKSAKTKFYNNCFEESKGNASRIWKTIKSLT